MLVSGAASGQDRLAQAAQSSAKTITHLTDVVKLGAASIGSDDPETQVRTVCLLFFRKKSNQICTIVINPDTAVQGPH